MEERCGQLLLLEGLIIGGGKMQMGAQGNIQREREGGKWECGERIADGGGEWVI